MIGRFLCLFGRHLRSRSDVHEANFELRSVCCYCGVPMRQTRDPDRSWQVIED